jgi:hypothetical protein
MTNLDKIAELNEIWYMSILGGGSGHKDRDCHFYITQIFSYGGIGKWTVAHHGYINHHYQETEWDTYEECQVELIKLLKYSILEELNWYIEHYGDPEWDQHNNYNKEQLEDLKKKVLEIAPD